MSQEASRQYQERLETFLADLAAARKASARLSNVRLAVFLAAAAGFLALIVYSAALPALALLALGVFAFAALVVRHGKVLAREKLSAALAAINEAGLKRLEGRWSDFQPDGREFADEAHAFAADLDLFGRASLFQWLNAARTRFGREALARRLAAPPRSPEAIRADQAAVAELAPRLDWRQRFEAAGRFLPVPAGREDPESLIAWAGEGSAVPAQPGVPDGSPGSLSAPVFALRYLPLLTIPLGLFGALATGIWSLFLLPFLLHLAIATPIHRRYGPILDAVLRHRPALEAYLELLVLAESGGSSGPQSVGSGGPESGGFAAQALKDEIALLRNPAGLSASAAVRRLQSMADWMESRRNAILQVLLNALCLWDLQWLRVFHRWRETNGGSLRGWLETLARLEVLSSLAGIRFENPGWAFPEIAAPPSRGAPSRGVSPAPADPAVAPREHAAAPAGQAAGTLAPLIDARAMGHPLLDPRARVRNDLSLRGAGETLIITGSNMSGKSTLLRTVGINLVLAYAGAPVCAEAFRCATLEVHTSMRLRDDLEKRISSFYAELLRLKTLVEAAREGRGVLFLVDEIFRGTNSKDRHAGAAAVLRQLRDPGASGLVSTHDLDLAALADEDPEHFRNFHFEEHFDQGRIAFDFKLRPGVSTTTNAIHLIRMVGLA